MENSDLSLGEHRIGDLTVTVGKQGATASDGEQSSNVGNASQLAQQGWQLWQKGQFAEAAAVFKQAVKLAPDDENAWNGLGWACFNSGATAEAKDAFERVIALNPNHPAALNGLGQLNLAQRRYDVAESYLLRAGPQAPAAWWGLTKIYLLQGKFKQAEKWAQMIVDSGQGDQEIARRMLQAAQEKRLPDGLRIVIEPQATKAKRAGPAATPTKTPPASHT